MRHLGIFITLLIATSGCHREPDSYPPPIQRKALTEAGNTDGGRLVQMNDFDAEIHFVRDISSGLEGGRWRWTNQRPELKIYLASTTGRKLLWDFSITPVTFEKTGPVSVSFYVNERLLGRVQCPKPGEYKFEKAVPPDYLKPDAYNFIAAQADKLWVSPTDGVRLGFTMTRAGFLP